jgi:glycosyltransferase involved in cell wall biosynthesis
MSGGRPVLQVVPTFAPRDAIGDHARQVDRLLKDHGVETAIYAQVAVPEVAHLARPFQQLATGPATGAVILHHHSTGTGVVDRLLERPEPVLVDYHNITPAELFEPWEPVVAAELAWGRRQLELLGRRASAALADSAFNAAELRALGWPRVTVAPIVRDLGRVDRRTRPPRVGTSPELLFVGRLSPNKCQHELIAMVALYRAVHGPGIRLRLVGGASSQRYERALHSLAADLGVADAVSFEHGLSNDELVDAYERASAFVSLSRHEGFSVPVLEAMRHGLPVVALSAAAITETVADGGLLLPRADLDLVVAALHRVTTDMATWTGLSRAGVRRAATFRLEDARRAFWAALQDALEAC